ncbi:putative transcriptional regulator YheO [Acidovorax soli]|uniref:Putative transcriptional regulator YheO n=1 Tax=Acidovorax soli TaxID=592050 RepID=A0A7X0UB79_9BURK|nr:PAS domain-containing protein [Acidovorax soli]MBB6561823.1 putative transcriptional regulator YheO [Acidovorax soli]
MTARPSLRRAATKPARTPEQKALLSQIEQVAQGLAATFAPFCEVVVHDLLDPGQSILAIHNNLSGRAVGEPTTELGLARIADPDYPQVIANYANQFADGRQAKSTSVGIKDSSGQYIAALCLNVDLTQFRSLQSMVGQFTAIDGDTGLTESLDPAGAEAIRQRIDQFAARLSTAPRALKAAERRALLRELRESGSLEVRRAMEVVAQHLGVSRATVYGDVAK